MAPYISSHPCDSVWLAPLLPNGAHWDILKNLVANTRPLQSTSAQAPALGLASWWWIMTSRDEDQRPSRGSVLQVDSGWTPGGGTVILAEWWPRATSLDHRNF